MFGRCVSSFLPGPFASHFTLNFAPLLTLALPKHELMSTDAITFYGGAMILGKKTGDLGYKLYGYHGNANSVWNESRLSLLVMTGA